MGGVAPPFLALDGVEWSASRACRFSALGTLGIGGQLGPRAGLDAVEGRRMSFPFLEAPSLSVRPVA
jgi:hypothetical protein